jgi:branched-chain amino acid transport system permease protein
MEYVVTLLILICIYTILTASLDLVLGYTGMYSFGHAALYGVGAYTAALVALKLGLGFLPALAAALLVTALVSLVTVIMTVRMEGDYFILGTFAVANVISSGMDNWIGVTNGANGLYGIPPASLFGVQIESGLPFLALCFAAMLAFLFIKWRLVSAPLGTTLQAIREDEVVAQVLGNNITRVRIGIFVIGGAATAIAGTLLAFYLRFLDPTTFAFHFTIFIWAALFVGGSVSMLGNIVGPLVLILFPEGLRFVGLSGTHVPHVQHALYGLLLIVLMMFRPQGLCGRHAVR